MQMIKYPFFEAGRATWQGYGAVAVIGTQFEVVGLHTGFVRGAQ